MIVNLMVTVSYYRLLTLACRVREDSQRTPITQSRQVPVSTIRTHHHHDATSILAEIRCFSSVEECPVLNQSFMVFLAEDCLAQKRSLRIFYILNYS